MGKLAVTGGTPVAESLTWRWPIWDESDHEAVLRALDSGRWCRLDWGRPEDSEVSQFEDEFARYHDAKHCVAVTNGTAAIQLALEAGGVEAGDEVLVPAVTFIASASAILMANAIPVFVDIDPETYQISAQAMEDAITDKTAAAVVVHYAGYPVDLDRVGEIAKKRGLLIVEDCAHAHGSEWRGRKVGAQINAGAFSFQSSKSLTCGEGGAVIVDDDDLAAAAFSLHHIGRVAGRPFYEHYRVAPNLRMTEMQGALLRSQLARLPEQTRVRHENGERLARALEQVEGVSPLKRDERITQRGYYFYIIRYNQKAFGDVPREKFLAALAAEGIHAGAAYGRPVYRNPVFAENRFGRTGHPISCSLYGRDMDYSKVSCPTAERICAEEQIALNNNVLLDAKNVDAVIEAIAKLRDNLDELRRWVCG